MRSLKRRIETLETETSPQPTEGLTREEWLAGKRLSPEQDADRLAWLARRVGHENVDKAG